MVGYFIGFGLNYVDPDGYNGWDGELRAAEADTKFYTELARKQGFKIFGSFLGEAANRDNVRKAFQNAINFAAPGDTVFVAYSGHGNQYKKSGKLYESYCLYDGQFTETELRNLIAQMRDGVRVLMVLDCCHAGGFDRNMLTDISKLNFRPKCMPRDVSIMLDPLDAKGEFAHRKVLSLKGKLVKWLVACDKTQTAMDGSDHGLFTASLLKNSFARDAATEGVTYKAMIEKSIELCSPYQTPQLKNNTKSAKFSDLEKAFT